MIASVGGLDRQGDAAREPGGIEVAEEEVGVGDGGLGAAAAVARGPGHRARRLRPDAQRAAGIDPRDAAAARADLGEVDGRDLHREPGAGARAAEAALAAHLEVVGDRGLAVAHDADLGGGAAHVEGDDRRRADEPLDEPGGGDARGAAGLERAHGAARRHRRRHHAAGGVHDLERPRDAELLELRLEPAAGTRPSPGPTYAHITVVMARSYSRSSGHTSDDVTTNVSGSAARSAAPTTRSWSGFAYEFRKQIATAVGLRRGDAPSELRDRVSPRAAA